MDSTLKELAYQVDTDMHPVSLFHLSLVNTYRVYNLCQTDRGKEWARVWIMDKGGWIDKAGDLTHINYMENRRVINLGLWLVKFGLSFGAWDTDKHYMVIDDHLSALTDLQASMRGDMAQYFIGQDIDHLIEGREYDEDTRISIMGVERRSYINESSSMFLSLHPMFNLLEKRVRQIAQTDAPPKDTEKLVQWYDVVKQYPYPRETRDFINERRYGDKWTLWSYFTLRWRWVTDEEVVW